MHSREERAWIDAEHDWLDDPRTDVDMALNSLDGAAVRLNAMHNRLTDEDLRDIITVWRLLGNLIGAHEQ